jgi:hypothetical protein
VQIFDDQHDRPLARDREQEAQQRVERQLLPAVRRERRTRRRILGGQAQGRRQQRQRFGDVEAVLCEQHLERGVERGHQVADRAQRRVLVLRHAPALEPRARRH